MCLHAPISNGSFGIFAGNFNHPVAHNPSEVITGLRSNLVLTKTALSLQLTNAHIKACGEVETENNATN